MNDAHNGEDPRILRLRRLREKARQGGGEKRIAVQHSKGKLTSRERLENSVGHRYI